MFAKLGGLPDGEAALAPTRMILKALGASPGEMPPAKALDQGAIANAFDEAFAFYDFIHSRAQNGAVMDRAQRLARRTLERIRLLPLVDR